MKRKFFLCVLYCNLEITYVHAECVTVAKLNGMAKKNSNISSSNHIFLGIDSVIHACWYFRDLSFENGHGEQSIFFYSKDGVCLGRFRTPLAGRAELHGSELIVEASNAEKYTVNLSKGIPSSIFFDGDISEIEKCAK